MPKTSSSRKPNSHGAWGAIPPQGPAIFAAFVLLFILLTGAANAQNQEAVIVSHTIDVTVDLEKRALQGLDRITVLKDRLKGAPLKLIIRNGSAVDRAELDGAELQVNTIAKKGYNEILVTLPDDEKGLKRPGNALTISVSFHGEFPAIENARENVRRGVAFIEDGIMGAEGAILPASSNWYPQEESGAVLYKISVTSPAGYTAVTEGKWITSVKDSSGGVDFWDIDQPVEGVDLVIGKYTVERETYKGIDIYTFFYGKDPELSKLYLDKTKQYLDLYADAIGKYPFEKFAVVESFLPTGYGMPSFTLLGSAVIRLPFIPDTSLGHEILHNWWGNSVFVDGRYGNWSEAITTYMADYRYERVKGPREAKEFRYKKLQGYKNFAAGDNLALKDFIDAETPASRAVGYNKGMMFFNMLENYVGPEAFSAGVRAFYAKNRFKKASWADIKAAFAQSLGKDASITEKDLDEFFKEWVDMPGGPILALEDVKLKGGSPPFRVSFTVKQRSPLPYKITLPVVITAQDGSVIADKTISMSAKSEEFTFDLPSRPAVVEVDPDYETFRVLADVEISPTLGAFFGDKNGVIIIPSEKDAMERYKPVADMLAADFAQPVITDREAAKKEYKDRSALIFGGPQENAVTETFTLNTPQDINVTDDSVTAGDQTFRAPGTLAALAIKDSRNTSRVICLIYGLPGGDREKLLSDGKRIRYFAQWSYLVFAPDGAPVKGMLPGKNLLRYEFATR